MSTWAGLSTSRARKNWASGNSASWFSKISCRRRLVAGGSAGRGAHLAQNAAQEVELTRVVVAVDLAAERVRVELVVERAPEEAARGREAGAHHLADELAERTTRCAGRYVGHEAHRKMPPPSTPASSAPAQLRMETRSSCFRSGTATKRVCVRASSVARRALTALRRQGAERVLEDAVAADADVHAVRPGAVAATRAALLLRRQLVEQLRAEAAVGQSEPNASRHSRQPAPRMAPERASDAAW